MISADALCQLSKAHCLPAIAAIRTNRARSGATCFRADPPAQEKLIRGRADRLAMEQAIETLIKLHLADTGRGDDAPMFVP